MHGELVAHLGRYLQAHFGSLDVPGISIGVTDRDGELAIITHGHADLAAKTPVSPDHLFQIGSISKGFTAIALLKEREAGRLDLDAPVTEYLPWFEVQSPFEPITVHHLLSHTAGIIMGQDLTGEAAHEVWLLRETEAGWAPGSRFSYSNVGYKALGLVLRAITGRPWWEVVQERILLPLGMTSTDPLTTNATRRRLAVGHEAFYDDRPFHRSHGFAPGTWVESATADGTICSTAQEMCAYVRALLNAGAYTGGRVMSEESFGLMTQRVIQDPDDPGTWWGYGLWWREAGERTYLEHTGGTVGYSARMTMDPPAALGVVVLDNGWGRRKKEVAEFALATARAVLGGEPLPEIPPVPDPQDVQNAAEYEGTYRSSDRALELVAEGSRLILRHDGGSVPIERIEGDAFVVPEAAFELHPLRFGRTEGAVVEAFHGQEWFAGERYEGPVRFDDGAEWKALPGHYRSYNPWSSNFRVFVRKGRLVYADPSGTSEDRELTPLGDGSFRIGEEWSPDRIRFDTLIDGRATRAVLDTAPFYRTFTP